MLHGSNMTWVGKHNRALIMRTVMSHGPIARRDIAQFLSLNKGTVSSITAELIEDGFLVEVGRQVGEPGTSGPKAILLSVNSGGGHMLCLSLDPAVVHVGIVDLHNRLLVQWEEPMPPGYTPEAAARLVKDVVSKVLPHVARLLGIGIAIPGIYDAETGEITIDSVLRWKDVPFRRLVQEQVDLPVTIDGRLPAVALAEHLFGAAKDFRHVMFVQISSGIGASFILNGRVHYGLGGAAGEIGHLPVWNSTKECGCGRIGCLETEASIPALLRAVKERGRTLDFDGLVEAFEAGDPVVDDVVSQGLANVRRAVAWAVQLVAPEVLVYSGPLVEASPKAFAMLNEDFTNRVGLTPRVERSAIDDTLGLKGIGALALDRWVYSGAEPVEEVVPNTFMTK